MYSHLKLLKNLVWPLAVAGAGGYGAHRAWRAFTQRALPAKDERLILAGLHANVEILRDRWGVPHIYAQNELDLFFAQGFVHAQDRLFQMDINRRIGSGRISEVVGVSGLAGDRFARYFGWGRAAQAQLEGASEQAKRMMNAYSAGVNAVIEQRKLPLEFKVLAYRPEPWSLIDTAAWGAVLAWGLSLNWETELARALLIEIVGPEIAGDLTPHPEGDYAPIMPDSRIGRRQAGAVLEAYHQMLGHFPTGPIPAGTNIGSNNWVINGSHSTTGKPVLANDPHLPPLFPAIWYENHLVGGDYQVTGYTMPGIPGVIIGHNQHVAWGITNGCPDIQDVYMERFQEHDELLYEVDGQWLRAQKVEEVINIRGRKAVREFVRYTARGPIFSDFLPGESRDLSLCWTAYTASNHLQAILDMNRARDWPTFRQALRNWGFPSQNVVFADTVGNIGYMQPGLIPLRGRGHGLVPSPGWDSDYDWQGWIPFEDLPQQYNPPEGIIVTANNRVHGSSYPYLLTGEWLPDYRARRISELLRAATPLSLGDHITIQLDTVSLLARRFLRAVVRLPEIRHIQDRRCRHGLRLLRNWDGDMRADRIAPTIYYGWLVRLTHLVFQQVLGVDITRNLLGKTPPDGFVLSPFYEVAPELIVRWLENGPPDWAGPIRPLLATALAYVMLTLENEYGSNPNSWQWGKLHRIRLEHPLVRIPILNQLLKPLDLAAGGDGYTVNQADVSPHFPPDKVSIVASCRLILDTSDWDRSLASLPGGQSGQPASDHYSDGVDDWRYGRYHPLLFSRSRVESAAIGRLILKPASTLP